MADPPHGHAAAPWSVVSAASVIHSVLGENRIVRELRHVGAVDSTQDALRALARAGAPAGTVLIADRQQAGRGRAGNRWDDDPSGGNLAVSLLVDVGAPPFDATSIPLVPHALGLAVVDAAAVLGPDAAALRLKWPNDVVDRPVSDQASRKLAGVLVERERLVGGSGERDVLLCGIGLNVDLGDAAPADRTDLASVLGERPDRALLLAALLMELDATLRALATPASLLDRYRGMSDTVGRSVRVQVPGEGALVGVATGIDDGGRLLVTTDARTHVILSGTVRDADRSDGLRSNVGADHE